MNRRTLLQLLSGAALIPAAPLAWSGGVLQNDRRLILLELSGANDGLNTVVPYSDERYYGLRPKIGLRGKQLIKLSDDFAFHHGLQQLMPLWEDGELAVIHGLGYPQPNRSHFKSIALWETGGDGVTAGRNGWSTHDLEHRYASRSIDAHGISLGGGMGVFASPAGNWLSMSSAEQFSTRPQLPQNVAEHQNAAMALLLEKAAVLKTSLDRIADKIERNKRRAHIGGGGLAQQLTHAANLINAGVDVPVIKVSLSGFDTHENQIRKHNSLLTQAAKAIKGLRRELEKSGQWDNTLVVTYSEFGRRARENYSAGTDHGTAACHLIAGGKLTGGFYGTAPDLGQLLDDDMQHTMDYRAVYSHLLQQWLQLPENRFAGFTDERLDALTA